MGSLYIEDVDEVYENISDLSIGFYDKYLDLPCDESRREFVEDLLEDCSVLINKWNKIKEILENE